MTGYGFFADVGRYKLLALGDELSVYGEERLPLVHEVPGLGDFVEQGLGYIRAGVGRHRDVDVIYIRDWRTGLAYAMNVDFPEQSGWAHMRLADGEGR